MTYTWLEAQHHLNRFIKIFLVIDVGGTLLGIMHHDGWFTVVWIVSGLIAAVIWTSVNQGFIAASSPEDDEFVNEWELAYAYAFAHKFVKISNLLATTVFAVGMVLGSPWWSNLLVAIFSWLAGLLGIPMLCAPRELGIPRTRDSRSSDQRDVGLH